MFGCDPANNTSCPENHYCVGATPYNCDGYCNDATECTSYGGTWGSVDWGIERKPFKVLTGTDCTTTACSSTEFELEGTTSSNIGSSCPTSGVEYIKFVTSPADYSRTTVIGANARASCSNCVVLGGWTTAGGTDNVGIGAPAPGSVLHIKQQGTGDADIRLENSAGDKTLIFKEGSSSDFKIYDFTTTQTAMRVSSSDGSIEIGKSGYQQKIMGFFNLPLPASETLISGGSITPTSSVVQVGAESGTVDDLDTIYNTGAGNILILYPTAGDTITVTENSNIAVPGTSCVLDSQYDRLVLQRHATAWVALSCSDNY
jgi:hypothetical protein